MANSDLVGKFFTINDTIKNHLIRIKNAYKGDKSNEGYNRLDKLLSKDRISYEQLKRIKNFFDNYEGDKNDTSYILNGGTFMKNWVDETLKTARENIKTKKKALMNVGMDNQFIKTHEKSGTNLKIDTPKVGFSKRHLDQNVGVYEVKMINNLLNLINDNINKIKK